MRSTREREGRRSAKGGQGGSTALAKKSAYRANALALLIGFIGRVRMRASDRPRDKHCVAHRDPGVVSPAHALARGLLRGAALEHFCVRAIAHTARALRRPACAFVELPSLTCRPRESAAAPVGGADNGHVSPAQRTLDNQCREAVETVGTRHGGGRCPIRGLEEFERQLVPGPRPLRNTDGRAERRRDHSGRFGGQVLDLAPKDDGRRDLSPGGISALQSVPGAGSRPVRCWHREQRSVAEAHDHAHQIHPDVHDWR